MLVSEGKAFPVEIRHLDLPDERPISEQAGDAVARIVEAGDPGDILVFMPGMAEINATIAACRAARLREPLAMIPLHGELPPEEQDLAFAPNRLRKLVVATNVAETSVTIDGIVHVIDSGLARVARYDAERGIGTLLLEPISRASADQRAGRAGRTAPGVCHRLWTESGHLNRPERNTPEIQRSDLAEVVLLLHSLGIADATRFDWLDQPDPQAVARAEKLLRTLGAIEPSGDRRPQLPSRQSAMPQSGNSDLTPIGWQMLRLPMHPRYSRMLVEASRFGLRPRRRPLRRAGQRARFARPPGPRRQTHRGSARIIRSQRRIGFFHPDARLSIRQEQPFQRGTMPPLRRPRPDRPPGRADLRANPATGRPRPARKTQPNPAAAATTPLPRCLMAGFIDQLCRRRDQGTLDCDLTEGRSGTLVRESVVHNAPLFVAASIREVSGRDRP